MAEENRKTDSGLNEPIEAVGGRTEENSSTKTTADGGTGRGRRRKTTDNSESGTTSGAEKEVVSGLAVVNGDTSIPQPEPKKAKRRRTRKPKTEDTALNAEQITAFLMAVSAVFSASEKESTKVFALSEAEAQQIAEPLSKLITNNDNIKEIVEKSDNVSLAIACAMVFLPKVFIFLQLKKNEKVLRDKNIKFIKGDKINEQKRPITGSHTNNDNNNNSAGSTANNAVSNEGIISTIPSLA